MSNCYFICQKFSTFAKKNTRGCPIITPFVINTSCTCQKLFSLFQKYQLLSKNYPFCRKILVYCSEKYQITVQNCLICQKIDTAILKLSIPPKKHQLMFKKITPFVMNISRMSKNPFVPKIRVNVQKLLVLSKNTSLLPRKVPNYCPNLPRFQKIRNCSLNVTPFVKNFHFCKKK